MSCAGLWVYVWVDEVSLREIRGGRGGRRSQDACMLYVVSKSDE